MKVINDKRCIEYSSPMHPERPARISRTLERLQQQTELAIVWEEPLPADEDLILEVHDRQLVERLEQHLDFDGDTPVYPDLAAHARRSVGAGLQALASAKSKEPVFSLMRPPGHHATRNRAMGFCYLNNIALATLAARKQDISKIAVFDFDVHHGNGTEDILRGRPGFGIFSIHQYPAYPGTGEAHVDNCRNYPVPPGLSRGAYRDVATRALEDLQAFQPELLAVSAGFDAYRGDPLCQQELLAEDYHWFGQTFRELGYPMFSLLEGGYSDDLPDLILAYLRGLDGLKPEQADAANASAGREEESNSDPDLEPFWGPSF
jgi:acetoin utilization deacetylase AcuC-like enzyme